MYKRTSHTLEHYIGFGRYQLFHGILIQWLLCPVVLNMAFLSFASIKPEFYCDLSAEQASAFAMSDANATLGQEDVCALIAVGECGNQSESISFHSSAYEFGLYCEMKDINLHIMSVQMVGVLLGAFVFGHISDTHGRKYGLGLETILIAYTGMLIVGASNSLAPDWLSFIIFRALVGLFTGGVATVAYVYWVEFLRQRHRLWATAVVSWPVGFVAFSALGYATQEWRLLTAFGNMAGLPVIGLLYFSKESPRWLVQRGYTEKALREFSSLATWNGKPIDQEELVNLVQTERARAERAEKKRRTRYTIAHLCYTETLSRQTLVLAFSWFTAATVNYGIIFDMGSLFGNPFVNMGAFGCLRLLISLFVISFDAAIPVLGRKVIHTLAELAMLLGFLFIIVTRILTEGGAIPPDVQPTLDLAQRFTVLFSAAMMGPVWLVNGLLSAELFPTPIRNIANSTCHSAARIGGILAPQRSLWAPGPYVLWAALVGVDLVLYLLCLPETKGSLMPEAMPTLGCCRDPDSCCFRGHGHRDGGGPGTLVRIATAEGGLSLQPPVLSRFRSGTNGTVRSDSIAVYRFNGLAEESDKV